MSGALAEAASLARSRSAQVVAGTAGGVSAAAGFLVSPITGAIALLVAFIGLAAAFIFALRTRAAFEGPYKVLSSSVEWTLNGPNGANTQIVQRRHVRFNYRSFVVVERMVGFPEGTIDSLIPDYGEVIKRGKREDEDYAIVELPADRQRSEEAHLTFSMTVVDGFPSREECWIGLKVPGATDEAALDVLFPAQQPPVDVCLRRKSSEKTETMEQVSGWEQGATVALWKEAGRLRFRLREKPKPDEVYRLTWAWRGP